jgi:hypothetical protein
MYKSVQNKTRHISASQKRGTEDILKKTSDNWMFSTTQGRINNQHPLRKSLNQQHLKKSFLAPPSKYTA